MRGFLHSSVVTEFPVWVELRRTTGFLLLLARYATKYTSSSWLYKNTDENSSILLFKVVGISLQCALIVPSNVKFFSNRSFARLELKKMCCAHIPSCSVIGLKQFKRNILAKISINLISFFTTICNCIDSIPGAWFTSPENLYKILQKIFTWFTSQKMHNYREI